jgi:hypothetical protein
VENRQERHQGVQGARDDGECGGWGFDLTAAA